MNNRDALGIDIKTMTSELTIAKVEYAAAHIHLASQSVFVSSHKPEQGVCKVRLSDECMGHLALASDVDTVTSV